ncbi:peptidyl-prolyl cis-trans isomerase [Coprobacter tertius]|uniref:Peptidylprolyl isomerase n=1 Tax=Coprobacter tertius TaxID=2944915 RepID=A0ABT1MKF4_9BACT|nr:peptidylprolyl isomerase [Coprobacter tertius]MCP9612173.1 peptidylprolyl isomerase [Coprobacter tertius]
MRNLFSLLICLFVSAFFMACNRGGKNINNENNALVRVGDQVLYRDELSNDMPNGLSAADSARFADNYIAQWVNDRILYDVAAKNIPDLSKIDQKVDRYREDLIIFEYKKQLLDEKLSKEISEGDLKAYYDKHADEFKLKSGIIRGLFIKVPVNSPRISQLKKWYRSDKPDAVENIEKYGLNNAVIYEYFYDRWVSFSEVMDNIPYEISDETDFLRRQKYLEISDGGYWYLLNISDYKVPGSVMPFDFAKRQIREILTNKMRLQFLVNTEKELYEKAIKDNRIEYYGSQRNKEKNKNK